MIGTSNKAWQALIALVLGFSMSAAMAQDGPPIMEAFETGAPQIGDEFPDLVVHDDLGNPVNIRDLADENYKVLVLGCLT